MRTTILPPASPGSGGGAVRACEWPGCAGAGVHRAPRSRAELYSYHWFCRDHARRYNAEWNYYAGMSEGEVEADVRRDSVWQRPTWPLGGGLRSHSFHPQSLGDGFGLFGGWPPEAPPCRAATPEEQAMVVLDLKPPLTATLVKARYKQLVKRHHPDANGGDKAAEERFKQIHHAYQTIMDRLTG